jgi:hypothetical protein
LPKLFRKRVFCDVWSNEATARLSFLPPDKVLTKLGSIGKGIPGVTLEVINGDGKTVQSGRLVKSLLLVITL